MIRRFTTKPFEIEAILFTGDNEDEIKQMAGKNFWLLNDINDDDPDFKAEVFDEIHSTWVGVKAGQWIIRGQKGEFYPCDPEIFAMKYEEIFDDVPAVVHKGEYVVSQKPIRTFGKGDM